MRHAGRVSSHRRRHRVPFGAVLVAVVALVAAAAGVAVAKHDDSPLPPLPLPALTAPSAGPTKVLVIVEENETHEGIVGDPRAPYLTGLAKAYGQATRMDAGFPEKCPSLAAYILLTSGDAHGICDDRGPAKHRLTGPNLFAQTTAAGRQWRVYSEDAPENCAQSNAGLFAVRHVPSNYYADLRGECEDRSVAMGTIEAGEFHDDVTEGRLPELGMLIPNLCNDMHGAKSCRHAVSTGDEWLRQVLPSVLAGPDYRAGRLVVFVVWDEGSKTDNHIPFVAVSPTTKKRTIDAPTTLCSVLATMSDVLSVDPLGCAATAESMAPALGLGSP